jgi:hypothetical protein
VIPIATFVELCFISKLSGPFTTIPLHILRLQMEVMASRYGKVVVNILNKQLQTTEKMVGQVLVNPHFKRKASKLNATQGVILWTLVNTVINIQVP